MHKRIAVIGIAISDRDISKSVNHILNCNAEIIVGRLGVPYRQRGISVISLIADGTNDEIGALTGKLGNLKGVKVKVAVMK